MAPIIRMKYYDKQHPVEIRKVVELAYGKFNVPFTRIFPTNVGFKVICRNETDADKIQSTEAKQELEKIGLHLIISPETKARKSIILRQLDQIIGINSAEDIKKEVEKENAWIKVEEVVKIKNYTHILKLRLEEISMVEKAKQKGILAYNMAISPSQIEQEQFCQILTCYKCYQLEDHQTKDCPYPNIKVCSECSENGHTFKDCQNQEKACINCKKNGTEADHRTLAMSCPIRKSIIKNKIDENKSLATNKDELTYAAIARRAVAEVRQPETPTMINLSEHKHTKILISIMHAHVMNLCNPGTYQTELNKMLTKNELPTMWFPDNPESGKLLGATITQTECLNTENNPITNIEEVSLTSKDTDENQMSQQNNRDPRLEGRSKRQDTGIRQKTRNASRTREENSLPTEVYCTPTGNPYPELAEEIGMKIYITGKHIMPTTNPHNEYILQQIQTGHFKWTYTDTKFEEDLIRQLISRSKVKITKNDFKRVDEGSFRKIRNGLLNRSPPEETRKQKK